LDRCYDLTPRELANAREGRMEREKAVFQAEYQANWEQIRWLAAAVVSLNGFQKKAVAPEKLLTFPWEKNVKKKRQTQLKLSEAKGIMANYKKYLN